MPIVTIKNTLDISLPSGNQIPITVLIAALKSIIDDYYLELGNKVTIDPTALKFTQILLDKLNGIEAGAEVNSTSEEISFINGLSNALNNKIEQPIIDNLIDSAPVDLNTLGKLALALANNPTAFNDLNNALGYKADLTIPSTSWTIYKNPTGLGTVNILEPGDKVTGFFNQYRFFNLATYNGGLESEITSFTIHDEIDTTP